MVVVLLHNYYDPQRLDRVVEEMKVRGAPTVRVYDLGFDDLYQAVEGSHRLRACEILGIEPIIKVIDADTPIEGLGLGVDQVDGTVAELGDWENYAIDLDDDYTLLP